ncbi:sulfite exporter TauE/SafE family protein [Salibacterium salarium]|uniref:Probable membrane transporter protein n=1 Tax=Salibacterium salarium TaxID=284579 RepID=A0A3R9QLL0_9BACI|nr:sulfite exporter TauE/SafE family protein [Salibacterium salarium]RSL33521.1 sulfite exporter TauE/SafE family protein [Salibacterium salarium]
MLITMFIIGLISGVITGLLSVGGGIILIFSLILIPPLFTQKNLSMLDIASFSIMQAFFSTLSGSLFYIREKLIDTGIVLYLGVPSFFGGIIGVIVAHQSTTDFWLRIIFALMAVSAAIVMQIPYVTNEDKPYTFSLKSYVLSVMGGLMIGGLGGLIGLAAGFIFVPVLIFFYHVPIKKAIGTSLVTCLLLATGSLLAKISITTVSFDLGFALIIGGVIGAQIGGRLNKQLSSIVLKRITAYSILLVSVKLIYDLF